MVLAHQARVALGDEVGECLRAALAGGADRRAAGLVVADSLGLYLTWQPHVGRTDADRNCISNIRPAGLPVALAAHKMIWLALQARRIGLSGVRLKDESDLLEVR